jgi:hypothetical protein
MVTQILDSMLAASSDWETWSNLWDLYLLQTEKDMHPQPERQPRTYRSNSYPSDHIHTQKVYIPARSESTDNLMSPTISESLYRELFPLIIGSPAPSSCDSPHHDNDCISPITPAPTSVGSSTATYTILSGSSKVIRPPKEAFKQIEVKGKTMFECTSPNCTKRFTRRSENSKVIAI